MFHNKEHFIVIIFPNERRRDNLAVMLSAVNPFMDIVYLDSIEHFIHSPLSRRPNLIFLDHRNPSEDLKKIIVQLKSLYPESQLILLGNRPVPLTQKTDQEISTDILFEDLSIPYLRYLLNTFASQ